MSLREGAEEAVRRAVRWHRHTQDAQGRWLGAERSMHAVYNYAVGLALDHEPADSPVIQDLCDFVESCATPGGGLGDYPGEPFSAYQTSLFIPFLKWARPRSPVLAEAISYLKRARLFYQDPTIAMSRWVFDPESRASVLADRGPPSIALRAFLRASRRHVTDRWSVANMFPRHYPNPSRFWRALEPLFLRFLTFPCVERLDEAASLCALPSGFDVALLACASLRGLAKDTSVSARRLYEFAKKRRKRFVFADGSYEWIALIAADLFFSRALGLEENARNASSELRKTIYQGDGWLRGDTVTPHVWDTALTVLALRRTGLPKEDPMIKKAVDYLREARSPVHGMWAWAYGQGMREKRPYADTDTTATACMALAACGESARGNILATAAQGLTTMQERSGAFSLYADGVVRPNWCWVSNASRSLQALVAGGLSPHHEAIRRGTTWLLSQQQPDGSWIDGWCVRYIYGTVMALEALLRCGRLTPISPETVSARNWLLSQQNGDGGWGENWSGARSASTCEQTGLALHGLYLASAADSYPLDAIKAGAKWLIEHQRLDGMWDSSYFMNFGFGMGCAEAQLTMVWALHGLAQAIKVLVRGKREAA